MWVFVMVPCFVEWFLVQFLVYQSSLERESWLLHLNCVTAVCVLCLFLAVPWADLQSVTYFFPCELSASRHVHKRLAAKSQEM